MYKQEKDKKHSLKAKHKENTIQNPSFFYQTITHRLRLNRLIPFLWQHANTLDAQ